MDFTASHSVPLPAFLDDDVSSSVPGELDLDDISRISFTSDGEDGEEQSTTLETEVLFGESYNLNLAGRKSLFSDRSSISAYDNLGIKRIGSVDSDDPLKMYVPLDPCASPRIGERFVTLYLDSYS